MFDKDFYPTPIEVIDLMVYGSNLNGKNILEPSAGKGNIVDYCIGHGAYSIIACEKVPELQDILEKKCKIISSDFFQVTSEMISHIDMIIMNPPFSSDDKHIIHAYNIAPPGCEIIALCNENTVKNKYSRGRIELDNIIERCGNWKSISNAFSDSERQTEVEVALIKIRKEGTSSSGEFDGFFMEEEEEGPGEVGIMKYNFIRDVVNRYIEAVKIFDIQLNSAVKMNNILKGFYHSKIGFNCTEDGKLKTRNDFKKDLQKEAWKFIFSKMNMEKYSTAGLRNDINKFVETQTEVPFTMRNIYHMMDIVLQTNDSRMERSLLEVFEHFTKYHEENRFAYPGWKTNSHYVLNMKFIVGYIAEPSYQRGMNVVTYRNDGERIADLIKVLCLLTGSNYDEMNVKHNDGRNLETNVWHSWGFFDFKVFKKGSGHFKFKDEKVWQLLNTKVAKLKGFPLPEHMKKSR